MRTAPYCTEVLGLDGPTGIFVEVLEMAVYDYGDNVLWQGTPGEQPEFRVPTRRVAVRTGEPCDTADVVI